MLQENRNQRFKKPESGNGSFNKIIFRYLPYWPLFLFLIIIGIAGAWIYLRYTVPIYESVATILIKDEKKNMESQILQELNPFGSGKIVENEIEILSSRQLSREVVKNLHLYAPITQEGTVVSRSGYVYSPVHIQVKNPDSLKPVEKVYFSFNSDSITVTIGKNVYNINEWYNTEYGELRFVINPRFKSNSEPQVPMYFSLLPVQRVANGIRGRLTISPATKSSTVLNLRLRDEVPQRAEDILNMLIAEYNKAAINDKNQLAANTLEFVNDRLAFVVNELDSVESRIQQYRTQHGIVDISEQGRQFLESVGQSDQRLSEINIQLDVLNQVEDYVSGKSTGRIVPSTMGVADPLLTQLLNNLYQAQTEYDRQRQSVGENNPMLIPLQEEISRLKPAILENIQNQRRNLQASKRNIEQSSSRYSSMLRTIPTKERELLEISRQQSIKNEIYTFLLQKREETALSYGSTVPDSRLIDAAETPNVPVSPNKNAILLTAIILAIGLGVLIVMLKEVMNRNILFRSEIEELTSLPIVGEIAHDPTKSFIVIGEGKRNFIAEQFRQLRTSLGYLGINSKHKRIMLTSTISGEGKSFISANLGISLALTGKKVVMLELDLRKPRLSSAFNLSRDIGLSNYFIGEAEPAEIIKKVDVAENLFIITSGPIPPNPSELILNGKLQELFEYLEKDFDYIIVDTAPVSPVTDAYIVSPMCDATLYVIRHGYTPKSAVKMLEANTGVKELKNCAIVFNDVKARGIGKNDYGYGYGYGAGYGYGYEEETGKKVRKKKVKKSEETV